MTQVTTMLVLPKTLRGGITVKSTYMFRGIWVRLLADSPPPLFGDSKSEHQEEKRCPF